MSYRPSEIELFGAPELGHIAIILTALDSLEAQLRFEHRTAEDPGPHPPPVLVQAMVVLSQIHVLRLALRRYRRRVLRVLGPARTPEQHLPF